MENIVREIGKLDDRCTYLQDERLVKVEGEGGPNKELDQRFNYLVQINWVSLIKMVFAIVKLYGAFGFSPFDSSMAALVMSLDDMIQNNRRNSVRGIRGGRGMRGVRGPRGTCSGDGRLEGPSCGGPLGVYGPRGAFRGAGRMAGPPCGVPLGMYGPGGTCRGAGRLAGRPRHGPLRMYGPGGTSRGAGRWTGPPRRGSLGTCAVEKASSKV
ncbi:hypothetical protein Leryth_010433 [Lithospermum erythrorhizon]|nr:hypothetical protein Leryth_010433 [Lithospermum erythrorhizon]